jgi:hypothetical protein
MGSITLNQSLLYFPLGCKKDKKGQKKEGNKW